MSAYWQVMVRNAFDRRTEQPPDRATALVAALELRARGLLTPRDIASALRLSEAVVRELLQG